jgi:nucleoredoxin
MLSLEKVLRHRLVFIIPTTFHFNGNRLFPTPINKEKYSGVRKGINFNMGFEFLGQKLLADKGNKIVDVSCLDAVPVVALYFSGHWCPPCKFFTPTLANAYNSINSGQKQLEIVFVSADQSEEDFKGYFATMPWLAMQFDIDTLGDVADKFDISSVPVLVVLNKDGSVKIANGKSQVEMKGAAVIDDWKH